MPELTHVIGIGASAGGLAALQSLFDTLPTYTDAAIVVVQHLSPDFKSLMDELLGRCTDMPVRIVQDGMAIEPGTVYLNVPRKDLDIKNDTFSLLECDLKSLPIQTLKIDRMFVENVGIDTAGDGVLVKATLALAHALGLTAVAEGVETEVQRQFLDDNGCDVLQGYFFHRPLGGTDLERLLRRDHPQNHPESLRLVAT